MEIDEEAEKKIVQFGNELNCNAVLVMSALQPTHVILMPTDPEDEFSVKLVKDLESRLRLTKEQDCNCDTLYKLPPDTLRASVLSQAEKVVQESEPINQDIIRLKKITQNLPVIINFHKFE